MSQGMMNMASSVIRCAPRRRRRAASFMGRVLLLLVLSFALAFALYIAGHVHRAMLRAEARHMVRVANLLAVSQTLPPALLPGTAVPPGNSHGSDVPQADFGTAATLSTPNHCEP